MPRSRSGERKREPSGVQRFCCSVEEVLEGMPQCVVLLQPSSVPSLSLTENVCAAGEGFLQISLHSAIGCANIILMSVAVRSTTMELHEDKSRMG